jgi:3-oxoacyl-[acyl-carrier protein] reductase
LLELDTEIVNQDKQIVLRGQGTVKVLQQASPGNEHDKGGLQKVAIVTGGAGGIGAAISKRLAADGFSVIVNYHTNAQGADDLCSEIKEEGGSALAVQADVSTRAGAEQIIHEAIRHFGGLGVVVNNASPRVAPMSIEDMDWQDFQKHIDVQIKGAVLVCKGALPHMVERGQGRIINIVSQEIEGTPTPKWSAYALGKSGVASISRYLAAEYGPKGICVNCVSPGMTDTRMLGDISEKAQLMTARKTPLRRLAKAEDIAGMVAFLASDDAGHITGQNLNVNGGMVMS